jgi:hypothetical protein
MLPKKITPDCSGVMNWAGGFLEFQVYDQVELIVDGLVSEVVKKAAGTVANIVLGTVDLQRGGSFAPVDGYVKSDGFGDAFDGQVPCDFIGVLSAGFDICENQF